MGFRRDVDGDYHGEDANLDCADWVVLAPDWAALVTSGSTPWRHPTQWEPVKVYGPDKAECKQRFDTLEAALLWVHMEAANGGS